MVKQREIKPRAGEQIDAFVEEFGNAALSEKKNTKTLSKKNIVESLQKNHDPYITRDFKSLTIRLNQYEYELFKAAAKASNRKTLDWMRTSLKELAEEKLSG